jgi:transcriptional regulator with XRE-family HTH domain
MPWKQPGGIGTPLIGTTEGEGMTGLLDDLRKDFESENARYGYAEGFLNAHTAAQIKTLREDREMNQQGLAEKIGTKQSGISRLENANYSSWKVETLRKLARAFGVWLDIRFREFGELPSEVESFRRTTLQCRKFEDDPAFKEGVGASRRKRKVSDGNAKKRSRGLRVKHRGGNITPRKLPVQEHYSVIGSVSGGGNGTIHSQLLSIGGSGSALEPVGALHA